MKKNLPIIIGISLPVVLVIVLIIATSFDGIFINPKYDFIYTQENTDYRNIYLNQYVVKEGKVTTVPRPTVRDDYGNYVTYEVPPIFLYDMETGTVKELEQSDLDNLTIDKGPSSPDGYHISFDYRRNYDLFSEVFGSGNKKNYNAYIIKGNDEKGIMLPNGSDNYSYYDGGDFIGWVIE